MSPAPQANALGLSAKLRLLVIDDHQLVTDGLRVALVGRQPHIELVTALDCRTASDILSQDRHFDLILLDLSLPDNKGLRFLRQLTQQRLLIPIAILSASEDPDDVQLALASGACGFISKTSSGEQIRRSVVEILEGKLVTPDFYYHRRQQRPADLLVNVAAVTPRQLEVLQLLARGLPNKKICSELNLTEDTVKTHLKSLFANLNVHNRTECVRVAAKLNLID